MLTYLYIKLFCLYRMCLQTLWFLLIVCFLFLLICFQKRHFVIFLLLLLYFLCYYYCQATTVVAYVILVFAEDVHPYWKMIFVSISQAFLPALTLSEVSRILPDHSVGVAFGVIEVLDSFVNVFGNIIFGVLYNSTGSYFMGMCLLLALSVAGFIVLAYLSILEMRLERFNSTASQRMYYEITSSSNETKEHRYESI